MKTKKGFTLVELLVVISIIALLLAILMPSLQRVRESAKRTVCSSQVKQIGVAMAAFATENNDEMPWCGGATPDKDEPTIHPWLLYRTGHNGDDAPFQYANEACVCGRMGKARPMRMAVLFEDKLLGDGKLLYCPSNTAESRKYSNYTNQSPAWGGPNGAWGRPHQVYSLAQATPNDWIRSGYDYYPIDRSCVGLRGGPLTKKAADGIVPKVTGRRFSQLSPSTPYLSDVICVNDGDNTGKKSQVSHRQGLKHDAGLNKDILTGAGINCLFSDGHVRFVADMPIVSPIGGTVGTLFDNNIWDTFSQRDSKNEGEYLMFNIYGMITP